MDTAHVLSDLRKARARRRRPLTRNELAYRLYLAVIFFGYLVAYIYGRYQDYEADQSLLRQVVDHGPAVGGLLISLLIAAAIRSGLRGGPTAPTLADSFHLLLAPIDRGAVLRPMCARMARWTVFTSLSCGAIAGAVIWASLGQNLFGWIASCSLLAAALGSMYLGIAMLVSGYRMSARVARPLIAALLVGSGLELFSIIELTPMSILARIALLPMRHEVWALPAAVLGAGLLYFGLDAVAGTSIEAAVRRASLSADLRFSLMMREMRDVVTIRRYLADERPRSVPWLGKGRTLGVSALTRRHWHGVFRWPLARMARLTVLGAVAGLGSLVFLDGNMFALTIPAVALFVAGLDATEILGQHIDRPDILRSTPYREESLVTRSLMGPSVIMIAVCAIGVVAAAVVVPTIETVKVGIVTVPVAALAAALAATYATYREPGPMVVETDITYAGLTGGLAPIIRIVQRPALTGIGLIPLVVLQIESSGRRFAVAIAGAIVSSILLAVVVAWLRYGSTLLAKLAQRFPSIFGEP